MARSSTTSSATDGAETARGPAPTGLLVIGFGNEIRADDAAGPRVVRALGRRPVGGVTLQTSHQLLPEFAHDLSCHRHVVFVDARLPDGDSKTHVGRVEPEEAGGGLGHALSPAALLALSRALYESSPDAWIVSVPTQSFEFGRAISPVTAAGIRSAARIVRRIAASCGYGGG